MRARDRVFSAGGMRFCPQTVEPRGEHREREVILAQHVLGATNVQHAGKKSVEPSKFTQAEPLERGDWQYYNSKVLCYLHTPFQKKVLVRARTVPGFCRPNDLVWTPEPVLGVQAHGPLQIDEVVPTARR